MPEDERTVHYETITSIRRDAGLLKLTEAATGGMSHRDTIDGALDGVNKSFHLPNIPIVDRNNDDEVTADDVLVFVDGQPVEVASITPENGTIELAEAPAATTEVLLIKYAWSPVSDEFIIEMRKGVEDWLDGLVAGVYDVSAVFASGVFPNEWKNITRLRTAGYLQIQDWGENVDTDGSSKDGYKKLQPAMSDLQDWIDGIINNDTDGKVKSNSSVHRSDRNVFGRNSFHGGRRDLDRSDEYFHNRRA